MITYKPRSHGDTEFVLVRRKNTSVPPCLRGLYVTAAAILAAACSTMPPQATAPSYELLITNAQIVDGTGGAPRKGSIAIAGGKIAAVGEVTGTGARTIDAKGRTVA